MATGTPSASQSPAQNFGIIADAFRQLDALVAQVTSLVDTVTNGFSASTTNLTNEARIRQTADDNVLAAAEAAVTAEGLRAARSLQAATDGLIAQLLDGAGVQQRALAAAVATFNGQISTLRDDLTTLVVNGDADGARALAAALVAVKATTDTLSSGLVSQRRAAASPGRPGGSPQLYTLVQTAASLDQNAGELPPVPDASVLGSESGPVVLLGGAVILAGRAPLALELGRLYRVRYVVQRRQNPADPTGDAVVCGVVYLDQSGRVVSGVVPVRTYPTLPTSAGRQECTALLSRTAGLGAAFIAPANARFVALAVQCFGADHRTLVEVLQGEDVTSAFLLDAPVADVTARVQALESGNPIPRIEVLESEIGNPSKSVFPSKGDAAQGTIPATAQVVELLGRQYPGDGGAGLYVRTSAELPPDADVVKSGGAVFVRVVTSPDITTLLVASGLPAVLDKLPTSPPSGSGLPWNNGQTLAWTP